MATDKKHIAVYLDKGNEKSLMEYIKQHGGIKYSAAVNQILATFFGNSLSNLPVTDELEATITRIVEEQLSKLPSITPSDLPSAEVLERLSTLENKLEDLSNIPETIPGNILEQEVVEPEQILSNIPGIAPSEVGSVSLEVAETARQLEEEAAEKLESLVVEVDAIAQSPDTSDEPDPELNALELNSALEPVAAEIDANAPVADPKLNSLEVEATLETDLETDPGLSEAAPPSEPVSEPTPNTETELLSGVQVCKLLKIKDYQLSKMSSDEIKALGFERVRMGRRSKYRKLL
ncbi:hypothetical protein Cri9333_4723 (plasmid) [Crinalium epipsammum PCC 9333]|uniref:Uncharacterized protein n=1 Tax=Crinalium epipsammum PCC 9333 TaxID=1173022 RepID=K9W5M2_9CYAN|nr:hypothetical protein [Crinalium epipsammum]AFZ15501.1 hypothetical protein Cri9333_4723 [Crinalium epipsammum PCC 9333]